MPPIQTTQRVRCYDVFDTVLTRLVSPPTAIFNLVGRACQEVLPAGMSPAQYAALRVQAEKQAQAWHAEAMTLDRIFEQLQFIVSWDEEVLRFLKTEEIAMEHRWSRPVPGVAADIENWRAEGGTVAFVSDMYLPSNVIEELLRDHGIYKDKDHLFVSCEHGAEKHDGRLFACVRDALNPSAVFDQHMGNHAESDVEGAKRAGLRASFLPQANPNRYEAILEEAVASCGIGAAQLAGASRYARLTTPAETAHEKALRRVAAGVISPLLVCFVSWVLKQAKKQSLKRLYFTSRDGQLLHIVARRLAPMLGLDDIELRYVYFSRASIARARCSTQMISQVWFRHRTAPVSGTDLLARIGLSFEDVVPHLPPDYTKSVIDTSPIEEEVFRELQSAAELHIQNYNNNQETEEESLLVQYMEEQGFMDNISYGFVDIGWRGSIHSSLNKVLLGQGYNKVFPGLFFGLQENQLEMKSYRKAYFFDRERLLGINSIPYIMLMMETFCTADHGTVISYHKSDECIKPVLEKNWTTHMRNWGLSTVRKSVIAFMSSIKKQPYTIETESILLDKLQCLLKLFWNNPAEEDARAWGLFPNELGQAGEPYIQPIAPPYDLSDLLYFIRYGDHAHWILKQEDPLLCWTLGRTATSPVEIRNKINLAIKINKKIRDIIRKFKI